MSQAGRSRPAWGRTLSHFHSFYDHGRVLPLLRDRDPHPTLWVNPDDAALRQLRDTDTLRIFHARGTMQAVARVTADVAPGVVWMHDGWSGINQLTSGAREVSDQVARSFPAGSASYQARVQVERAPPELAPIR